MRAHRRIHAAGHRRVFQHLPENALAHAVQALQLKLAGPGLAHLQNGGNGAGVVPGKLRVNRVGGGQQRLCAGQVGHIGVVLVREHGVMRQPQFLRAFDLRVPIRAFDQAAHQAQLIFARQADHVVHQFQAARLVSLHGQTKALPARMVLRHLSCQRLEHIQRQFEPVHLFRVNRQVDVGDGSQFTQTPDTRHQLGHDAGVLRCFKPRMQGTQFDGNTIVLLACPGLNCLSSY